MSGQEKGTPVYGHGGARPGSGRKSYFSDPATLRFLTSESLALRVNREAISKSETVSVALHRIVSDWMGAKWKT